jgi:predicted nucleotidyltransferase
VNEDTRSRLARALDQDGVVAAFVFGSQATERAGPLSDVDIAVWLDPMLDADARLAARLRLGEAASSALETDQIDLVVLNDAPPLLQQRARESAVPILERDARSRIRLESRALVEYLDTQPLRDELARGTRQRIAEGRFGR